MPRGVSDVAYLDVANPTFSIGSPAVLAAREANWYARTPYGIAVLRYDAVRQLLNNRLLGQGSRRWPEHNGVEGPFADWWHRSLINLTGDEHARLRRISNPAFSPRVVAQMVPDFQALANELIDAFVERGRCEFVSEFSQPYATRVICKLLGASEDDWEALAGWTSAMGLALGVTFRQDLPRIEAGLSGLIEFVDEMILRRREQPDDGGTVARLISAQEAGQLSELELRETIVNLVFGGVDTTRNQLGLAMDLFLAHPEQWALLGQEPELAEAAVEEVLRLRPTTTWVTREALEDFTFEGLDIEKGTTIHLFSAVAGTDPRMFGDTAGFDITAERPPHFAFGGGRHHCLGHFVARRDMTEALALLAQRLPSPTHDGPAEWLPDSGNTGPVSLPIRFGSEQ